MRQHTARLMLVAIPWAFALVGTSVQCERQRGKRYNVEADARCTATGGTWWDPGEECLQAKSGPPPKSRSVSAK